MLIYELLELKNRDMISIVGAGGKTTLMFLLASELEIFGKVLVTTTTKIYKPDKKEVKYLALGKEGYEFIKNNTKKGIYAYGKYINEDNKLISPDLDDLNSLKEKFNYILIEADGSKRKCLKAWNDSEPVISNETNKTLGVLSLKSIGMEINNENIHRVEEFITLTNSKIDEKVSLETIIKIIFNEKGLFKNATGEKILFLNACDLIKEDTLSSLIYMIKEKNEKIGLLSKVIYGSLKERNFSYIML